MKIELKDLLNKNHIEYSNELGFSYVLNEILFLFYLSYDVSISNDS